MLRIALPLMLIFALSSTTWAEPEVCESRHYPSKILKKISCDNSSEVLIVGEQHQHEMAEAIKDQARDLGQNKDLFVFLEGIEYRSKQASYVNGLEDRLILSVSGLLVTEPVLRHFASNPPNLDDPKHNFVLTMSKRALANAVFDMDEVWGDLSWYPDSLKQDTIYPAVKQLSLMPPAQRRQRILEHKSFYDFSNSTDYRGLGEAAQALLRLGHEKIRTSGRYGYLNADDMASVLGSGRDIVFSKAILENYCHASRAKKPIWVQVGIGHSRGVECFLRNHLPAGTIITRKELSELEPKLKNWKTDIETSVLKDIRDYVLERAPQTRINVYSESRHLHSGTIPEHIVQIVFEPPIPQLYPQVVHSLRKKGYAEVKWRNINTSYRTNISFTFNLTQFER